MTGSHSRDDTPLSPSGNGITKSSTKNRRYRNRGHGDEKDDMNSRGVGKGGDVGVLALLGRKGTLSAAQAAQLATLEEEVVRNVEEAVKLKVEEMMQSDEVQHRIQVRLKEERAKLEENVAAQLDKEKADLLGKKRREQDEARRRQDDLERILAENRRKVEEAQARALMEKERREKSWASTSLGSA